MSHWSDEVADKALEATPVEVHLYLEQKSATEFRECFGYGYKPQTIHGQAANGGIVYPPATFVFNGPVGEVRGAYFVVNGRIRNAESFVKPIPIVTPGSKIEVVARLD